MAMSEYSLHLDEHDSSDALRIKRYEGVDFGGTTRCLSILTADGKFQLTIFATPAQMSQIQGNQDWSGGILAPLTPSERLELDLKREEWQPEEPLMGGRLPSRWTDQNKERRFTNEKAEAIAQGLRRGEDYNSRRVTDDFPF